MGKKPRKHPKKDMRRADRIYESEVREMKKVTFITFRYFRCASPKCSKIVKVNLGQDPWCECGAGKMFPYDPPRKRKPKKGSELGLRK